MDRSTFTATGPSIETGSAAWMENFGSDWSSYTGGGGGVVKRYDLLHRGEGEFNVCYVTQKKIIFFLITNE